MSSLYEASVPVYRRGLTGLRTILEKAEGQAGEADPSRLLSLSIAERLSPVSAHVHSACSRAMMDTRRVLGVSGPRLPKPQSTFGSLYACIAETDRFLEGVRRDDLDRAGDGTVTVGPKKDGTVETTIGREFLLTNSIPQFFFHLTTIYVIFRSNGVALRKPDFLGTTRHDGTLP